MNEARRGFLLNALKLLDLTMVIGSFGLTVLVLYAGRGEDFADAARRVAMETRDAIEACR